jgi:hypothetical protein
MSASGRVSGNWKTPTGRRATTAPRAGEAAQRGPDGKPLAETMRTTIAGTATAPEPEPVGTPQPMRPKNGPE